MEFWWSPQLLILRRSLTQRTRTLWMSFLSEITHSQALLACLGVVRYISVSSFSLSVVWGLYCCYSWHLRVITLISIHILQVTIPLGKHGDRPISVSFLTYYGGDKFLLDTILEVYASLQDQADIASTLAPVTDSNGIEASEVMKEKVKTISFVLSSERERYLAAK